MDQQEYNQMISDLKEHVANGDVECMKYLGDLYYQGTSGTDENIFAALPYWKMAADHGDSDTAFKVGLALMTGTGCEKDHVQGFKYLKQSADDGNADAQYKVGLCLLDGLGTSVDPTAGEEYLRAAAYSNHPQAQLDLARVIMQRGGDALEATHWMCCAHLNGNKDATNSLHEFVDNMDGADIFVQHRLEYIQEYGITPPGSNGLPSSAKSSGAEGCYIATAVYGSYDAPEVLSLREFRDGVLQKHWWGKLFIKVYYFISPPIAKRLKNARRINALVRVALDRFVARLSRD